MSRTTLETVSYGGWNHCLRLTNGTVELIITIEVGPRVIRFGTVGGQNLFKEFEEQMGKTKGDEWFIWGGHRLWHAPEAAPRTYAMDFDPVAYTFEKGLLTLSQVVEPTTGIEKQIEIRLTEDRVQLNHRLINRNLWTIEVSPWCLSVMAAGGRALIPHEPFVEHGVSFDPARPLVLWQFTRMDDPRYSWGDRLIQFRYDASQPTKQKFGLANKQGWAAYHLGQQLFVKTFDYQDGKTYPDYGCNCEFFTMPGFLEVESLGPMTRLDPGHKVDHRETWFLFDKVELPESEKPLLAALKPYLKEIQ